MFNADPLHTFNNDVYGSSHNKVVRTSQYTMSNVFKAYATYNFKLQDKHNFKAMVGFDAETREKLGHYSEGRGMISTTLPEINLTTGDEYARTNGSSYNYHNDFAAAGFFGRINYDYMGKYSVTMVRLCSQAARNLHSSHPCQWVGESPKKLS